MQGYFALGTLVLLVVFVVVRSRMLKRLGIDAFRFGEKDRKDFLIPPFVLVFFYLLVANIWGLPGAGGLLMLNETVAWFGVLFCFCGLCLFVWAIASFGASFRVGLDEDAPGGLVTTGAFSISRNPIYVAFFFVLLGIVCIFPTWVFLVYLVAAVWLFNRQVRLEEESLKKIYGASYAAYCRKVRRYL